MSLQKAFDAYRRASGEYHQGPRFEVQPKVAFLVVLALLIPLVEAATAWFRSHTKGGTEVVLDESEILGAMNPDIEKLVREEVQRRMIRFTYTGDRG